MQITCKKEIVIELSEKEVNLLKDIVQNTGTQETQAEANFRAELFNALVAATF